MSIPSTDDDRPRTRSYARIERERRFRLAGLPEPVDPTDFERLRDRYLEGTQLRLRRIERPDGDLILVKLGQKRLDPHRPDSDRHRQMTTFYLRPRDEAPLAGLPARVSVKRRYRIIEQDRTWMVDVYEEPRAARGIVVAEVECPTDEELDAIVRPAWAEREVTGDPSYSGWELAAPEVPA